MIIAEEFLEEINDDLKLIRRVMKNSELNGTIYHAVDALIIKIEKFQAEQKQVSDDR